MGRSVTVKDVAALAGVSTATVSRVLSSPDTETVRPATREAVLRAATELGYHRSTLPAQMRRGRSDVFGVVVGDIENPFYTSVVKGFECQADELGFRVILVNTNEDPAREEIALTSLASERAAGVALAASSDVPSGVLQLVDLGIPVVTFDNRVESAHFDSVTVDNRMAARRAIEYLVQLGHQRIGMISGPVSASSINEREIGWTRALPGGKDEAIRLVRTGDLREQSAYDCAIDLLKSEKPTAIFSVNNFSTIGIIRAAHDLGIDIPTQLSLIGFDDFPLAQLFTPPLTVIAQPTTAIGGTAAQLLHRRLLDSDAPIQAVVLKTRLIERGSTVKPAVRTSGSRARKARA